MADPIPDNDIDENSEQNEAGTQAQDVTEIGRAHV